MRRRNPTAASATVSLSPERALNVIVETHELTKTYRTVTALDRCNLEVGEGEVFGLLGPNGAGKTTLIRLLLGYLRPTAGRARIAGFDCQQQSVRVREVVSYLPAEASLFPQMRGRDVLRFFSEIRPGSRLEQSLAHARRLELDLNRKVGFMSTGMRQKLALAATMAAEASVYILDEPTANLDPTVRAIVLAMVSEARQRGSTVLFSSHVLSEVEEVCDRVVILRAGQVVHTQSIAELRAQHRITAWLAGDMPLPPPALSGQVRLENRGDGQFLLETPGELAPLLGWLATLPLREVRIEQIGLRAVYDRYHADPAVRAAELRPLPNLAGSQN
jgi:ABC-2 type transport system ATP-binding protein